MYTSVIVDGIVAQQAGVVRRAALDTVAATSGSTSADIANAVEYMDVAAQRKRSQALTKSANLIIPRRVPYSIKEVPRLPVARRVGVALDVSALMERAKSLVNQVDGATKVVRKLEMLQAGGALDIARSNDTTTLGGGKKQKTPAAPGTFSVERVPSIPYLCEHISRRVDSGWGRYDIHFMKKQDVGAPDRVYFTLGSGQGVEGMQKLVNRVITYLMTRRGTDIVNKDYGSLLLTSGHGNSTTQGRINVVQSLAMAVRYFRNIPGFDDLPSNERLLSLELLGYSTTGAAMFVRMKLTTDAGATATLTLPVSSPEVAYGH
jgi:hypothetical protein